MPDSATPSSAYPLRVHAYLDQPLSRWWWLVKPILLIPHLLAATGVALITALARSADPPPRNGSGRPQSPPSPTAGAGTTATTGERS